MREFRRFAGEMGLEVWFSASVDDAPLVSQDSTKQEIPGALQAFADEFAVVVVLVDLKTHIHLELIKDHDNAVQDCHLKLDPRILLIAEET